MTNDVSQEALLAFELFQRSPHGTKSRRLLDQHLVEVAMYNDEAIRTTEEIRSAVLTLLNEQIAFSHEECKRAADNCNISGSVKKSGDDIYVLTKQTKKRLKNAYELIQQVETSFDKGLSEYVGRRLGTVINPFAEVLLCSIVKETVQGIFYRNAIKLRELLEGELNFANLIEFDTGVEKELVGKLETFISIQSEGTAETTVEGIKWFLANLSAIQKHYLATLHHRVFYFQILNVDPRLQEIEETCCRSLRLYLDTNILVRYLCDGSTLHEPILSVVTMSKELGIKLLISSKTLLESERLVNAAKGFSMYLENSPMATALLSSSIAMNNPFVEAFLVKRRQNPKLKWSGYISRFDDLEILLLTNDIEVSDDDISDIVEDESYPLVHKAVIDVKDPSTAPEIINHDSYNIVLIQRLRDKYPPTLLGSSVWLLTIDSTLRRADRRLRRAYPSPHCRTIDQWGGLLLPFQNIGRYVATDEYISYLVSQQMGVIFPEKVLDVQFVRELEKSDIDLSTVLELDPEIALHSLVALQVDREARTLLTRIQTSSDEEKEPIVRAFYDRALSMISDYKEEERQRDKKEIERLQKGLQKHADELRKMESAVVTDQDRIELLRRKVSETQKELDNYRKMPFWQRVRFLFRG